VNRWHLRPNAHTQIPNMFLAADYVRTNMGAATMESANEAARRAVNHLLQVSGSKAPRCKIWSLKEPEFLIPLKWYDHRRFQQGLPWGGPLLERPPVAKHLDPFVALSRNLWQTNKKETDKDSIK
ncbi:MAG: FAD-dependent oxidoreductase, partial [Chloroflexota bacterium]